MTEEKENKKIEKKNTVRLAYILPFVFIIAFSILAVPIGLYQITMYDINQANLIADLYAQQNKCMNILEHNTNDLPDFINYERAGSDRNSFGISSECYKLINDFNVVKEREIKLFNIRHFLVHLISLGFAIIVTLLYLYVRFSEEANPPDNYYGNNYY